MKNKWKILLIAIVAMFTLISISCQPLKSVEPETPRIVESEPPEYVGSSIYLRRGGEVTFTLAKGEIRSVIIFLENNEYVYISYNITPYNYQSLVDYDIVRPDGSGSSPDFSPGVAQIGGDQRGYYTVEFEFDLRKSESNKIKHSIDFNEAQELWDDPDLIEIPVRSNDEPRCLVIAKISGE